MIPMAKNRHKKNKELDDQALESAWGGFGMSTRSDGVFVGPGSSVTQNGKTISSSQSNSMSVLGPLPKMDSSLGLG